MHAEGVIKVAEELANNLQSTNPSLRTDIQKLLPKLPSATRGPHDQIPNANQLPVNIFCEIFQIVFFF